MNLLDEILKERKAKMQTGVFCCDDCGKEYDINDLVVAGDEMICERCEEEREDF